MKVHNLSTARLVSFARRFKISRPDEAAGRCLSASLDFAQESARLKGFDAQLVRWCVVGDPSYLDHWAVLLDEENVIDLTRIQVDGSKLLVCPIQDYPTNYRRRRVYPASLFLPAYAASGAAGLDRLPDAFLWTCGMTVLRFDLSLALKARDPFLLLSSLRQGVTFLKCFAYGYVARELERRAIVLFGRLHSGPEISARSTGMLQSVEAPVCAAAAERSSQALFTRSGRSRAS